MAAFRQKFIDRLRKKYWNGGLGGDESTIGGTGILNLVASGLGGRGRDILTQLKNRPVPHTNQPIPPPPVTTALLSGPAGDTPMPIRPTTRRSKAGTLSQKFLNIFRRSSRDVNPYRKPVKGWTPPSGENLPSGLSYGKMGGQLPYRHGGIEKYAQFHDLSQEDYDAAVQANILAESEKQTEKFKKTRFKTIADFRKSQEKIAGESQHLMDFLKHLRTKNRETGGMYNQQFRSGGTPKKGEFGSGRDAYTDEEWANMSSADRNRALGRIAGGRPGNYTGIKISDPDWYSERIISHYRKPDDDEEEEEEETEQLRGGGLYNQMPRYEAGGTPIDLPGGQMSVIPGSDAVEFSGATHDQGGITMGNAEVENDETMDQITAKSGGLKDYFFSSHLKEGGISYADMHKDILDQGGNQEDIDYLAAMQEQAAGRDPSQIQTAKLGGIVQYATGGTDASNASIYTNPFQVQEKSDEDILKDKLQLSYPMVARDQLIEWDKKQRKASLKKVQENIANKKIKSNVSVVTKSTETKSDLQNEQEDTELEAFGEGFTSGDVTLGVGTYTDAEGNIWEKGNEGEWRVKYRKAFGEGTDEEWTTGVPSPHEGSLTPYEKKAKETPDDVVIPPESKDPGEDNLSRAAMIGQLFPATMAFMEKPDYIETQQVGEKFSPVLAGRVKSTSLDRVDFNAQRAKNAADYRSINKFVETSGGGPSNIINKMSAYSKKQIGDRAIDAKEAQINTAIGNQEAQMNQRAELANIKNAMDASVFNVKQASAMEQFNANLAMTSDEFNRSADAATKDRRLMALNTAMSSIAGMNRDRLMYDAQDRISAAIAGQTGIMSREQLSRDMKKAFPAMDIDSDAFKDKVENAYLEMMRKNSGQTNPQTEV